MTNGFPPSAELDESTWCKCVTVKLLKRRTSENFAVITLKFWTKSLYHREMHQKDAEGIANSVDPDQTAPLGAPLGAVWSGSALFAQRPISPKT